MTTYRQPESMEMLEDYWLQQARYTYRGFQPEGNPYLNASRMESLAAQLSLGSENERLLSASAHAEAVGLAGETHSNLWRQTMLDAAASTAQDILGQTSSVENYWHASRVLLATDIIRAWTFGGPEQARQAGQQRIEQFMALCLHPSTYKAHYGELNELAVSWLGLDATKDRPDTPVFIPAPFRLDTATTDPVTKERRGVDILCVADPRRFNENCKPIQVKSIWHEFEVRPYKDDIIRIAADSHLGDKKPGELNTSIALAIMEGNANRIRTAKANVLSEISS